MIFLKPKIRNLEGWVFCNYGNKKLKFKETAQNMRKRIEKTDQKFQMQVPLCADFYMWKTTGPIEQCTIVHCTLGHVNITIIKPTTIHPIAPPKKPSQNGQLPWLCVYCMCVLLPLCPLSSHSDMS